MKSTTEIEPCVCGGKAIPCQATSDLKKKCYVKCIKCERRTEMHSSIAMAVVDWNYTVTMEMLTRASGKE